MSAEAPTEQAAEFVNVRRDALEGLLKVCACYAPHPPAEDIKTMVQHALEALGRPGGGGQRAA